MKKILSAVISFILVLSAFSVNSFAQEDIEDSLPKEYISTLNTLGVLTQTLADEDYPRNVTKAELTGAIVDLMGMTASYEEKRLYSFSDVTGETPNAAKIEFALSAGLVEKSSLFHPELNAETDDALVMLIRILGYEQYASIYSDNWLTAAKTGLLDGVDFKKGSSFTWNEFAKLLYNAAQTELMRTVSFNQDGAVYEVKEGQTLLTENFDIYEFEGVVRANEFTSLETDTGVSEGFVQIDKLLMKTGSSKIENLIGYSVRGYAKLENGKYTVLQAVPGDNKIWGFDDEDLIPESSDWSAYCIVYDDDGSVKKLNLSSEVDVIYNGKCCFGYTADTLRIENGNIIVIDNNTNGKPDTVIVNEIENYIVKAYDSTDKILYDKTGKKLNLDENDVEADIVNAIDEPYDLSGLTENTIISLQVSTDKTYIKGYVTKAKVTGIAREVEKDGDRVDTVTLDNSSYQVARNWHSAKLPDKAEVILGKRYIGYLDVNGEIAYLVQKDLETVMYGFLYEFGTEKGIDAVAKFRIFTEEGIWTDYEAADKINVNGKSYKGNELAGDAEAVAALEVQDLVKFEINSENKIKTLYTAVQTKEILPENQIAFNAEVTNGRWDSSGHFGLLYGVDGTTAIFHTPLSGGAYDKDRFDILTSSNFSDDRSYSFKCYDLDEFQTVGAMVVSNKSSTDYWNSGAIMVKKLTSVLDENGDETVALKALNKGQEVTCRAVHDEYISHLGSGDIIIAHFNSSGLIDEEVKVLRKYDKGNNVFLQEEKGGFFAGQNTYTAEAYVMSGYVTNKNAAAIVLDTGSNKRYIPLSLVKYITVFDPDAKSSEDIFTPVTTEDIIYSDNYSDAGKVFVYLRSGNPLDLIILK